MDITKIVNEVVQKLNIDPALLKEFAADPAGTLKKKFNVNLPEDQINQIIKAVKSQVKLPAEATGFLAKLKGLFGKK